MGFHNDLMGFHSDLMGFYSDLMGYSWDIPSGKRPRVGLEWIYPLKVVI